MKKIVCILLVVISIVSLCSIGVSANETTTLPGPPYVKGDANSDFKVSITDATEIQLVLVRDLFIVDIVEKLADVDNDDKLSILDATTIQMYVAKKIDKFEEDTDTIINFAYLDIISLGDEPETVKVGESLDIVTFLGITEMDYKIDYDKIEYKCTLEQVGDFVTELPTNYGSTSVVFAVPAHIIITMEATDEYGDYTRYVYEFDVVE